MFALRPSTAPARADKTVDRRKTKTKYLIADRHTFDICIAVNTIPMRAGVILLNIEKDAALSQVHAE
jgi:hypothetical protein